MTVPPCSVRRPTRPNLHALIHLWMAGSRWEGEAASSGVGRGLGRMATTWVDVDIANIGLQPFDLGGMPSHRVYGLVPGISTLHACSVAWGFGAGVKLGIGASIAQPVCLRQSLVLKTTDRVHRRRCHVATKPQPPLGRPACGLRLQDISVERLVRREVPHIRLG